MRHYRQRLWLFLPMLLLAGCTGLFFQPLSEHLMTPQQRGLAYEESYFLSDDGLQLHGWWMPAATVEPARGTVMQLHGNAENISTHFNNFAWLPAAGYNLFVFDYRGYGWSQGRAELAGMHRDVVAALNYLLQQRQIKADHIVMIGQSLGGAIALCALAEVARDGGQLPALLVTEGAFASYPGIASDALQPPLSWLLSPFIPLLINDDYHPERAIAELAKWIPLYIVHSQSDQVVPFAHGKRLADAAPQARFVALNNVPHIDFFNRAEGHEALLQWLSVLSPVQ
ncbi:MAG: alpha/beta hydrolase [Gammaproteobacteria bacterium]|nr:alpha/beta hydrolase [Gammaproteobacteria bacterium]